MCHSHLPRTHRALLELVKSTHFSHLAPSDSNASPASASAPDPEREQRQTKKKGKKHGLPKPPPFAGCEVVFVDESSVPGNGVRARVHPRRVLHDAPHRLTLVTLIPAQPDRTEEVQESA